MNDEFDLTFRSQRRHSIVQPLRHASSVKVAAHKFANGEYLAAIIMAWVMIKKDINFTISPYIIGYCYENAIELKSNSILAIKFYSLSAQSGFSLSQLRLAKIYNSQAFKNPKFYYNMAYYFYTLSYKNKNAHFYDKLTILYLLAKLRILMYISRISIDTTELILIEPKHLKIILVNECGDLDNYIKK